MICITREQQVMLHFDLAKLYGYEVSQFNRQVKRNSERFPKDFMFQLSGKELDKILRCQNGISKKQGGRRYLPYAFTEQGIYMLATVLKGETAINQSILIMRTFKEMKHYIAENKQLFTNADLLKLSYIVKENKEDIKAMKQDINKIMDNFIDEDNIKEITFLE